MVKTKNTTYLLLTALLMVFLPGNNSFAQVEKSDKVTPFEIHVTQTRKGIDLVCKEGCAWQRLTFNTPNKYKPQAINRFGMIKDSDAKLSNDNFAFTIQKTDKGMSLNTIQGTAWLDLSFSMKNGQERKLTELGIERPIKSSPRRR